MTQGHASMRDKAEVSFELADQVVQTVLANGAIGARLIGGGFGGSMLALVPHEATEAVTTAAKDLSPGIRFLGADPSGPAQTVRTTTCS